MLLSGASMRGKCQVQILSVISGRNVCLKCQVQVTSASVTCKCFVQKLCVSVSCQLWLKISDVHIRCIFKAQVWGASIQASQLLSSAISFTNVSWKCKVQEVYTNSRCNSFSKVSGESVTYNCQVT